MAYKQGEKTGLMTRALHAGWSHDPATGSFGLPVYMTAGYRFESPEMAMRLFELEEPGHLYSRISNPTVTAFEQGLTALEGGVDCVATASGQAAFSHLLSALCSAGDHVVAGRRLYGGTLTLLKNLFGRLGLSSTVVETDDLDAVRAAVTPQTRCILTETIGNPVMNVAPLEGLARIARENEIPLVVDNTFASPALCRPFEWGASIVIHSATKYISGHGHVIAGAIVDGGNMDWKGSEKWGFLTQPDPSYHGLVFSDRFGPGALAAKIRCSILRDLGGCLSPFNAYLLHLGLATLPLRMSRHSENALKVASFLEQHPAVEWVRYPGLSSHPQKSLADRYLPNGAGGMLAFCIKGGVEAGKTFLKSLQLFATVANLGDSRSMALHPASTTHGQLTPADRKAAGIEEGLIRLSVGIEDIDDILADLDQALESGERAGGSCHGRTDG
ncbi:MAG: O-acetylhomoserine aminocarboxypropyltransferase/cysteine synthase [Synergistaceae bacterium]|nr:O-acetylhomoserine aminocarboxypropyltransferase/cysteine synthase [Synergistaceae bacterium]